MHPFWYVRVRIKLLWRWFADMQQFCKRCGRTCRNFTAPDAVWEAVEPHIPHGYVLCYDCFCDLCDRAGIRFGGTWLLQPAQ